MLVIIDTAKIRKLMQTNLINREELSKRSGLSMDRIAHLFSGRFKRVQHGSLERIAGAFNVDPVEIVGNPETMKERMLEIEEFIEAGRGTPAKIRRYVKEADTLNTMLSVIGY